jgi:hypothetical protein
LACQPLLGLHAADQADQESTQQGLYAASDHAPVWFIPVSMMPVDPDLVARLAEAAREFDATAADLERNCWMAVHRHVHGVLPSEYDIREVPEELYLAVLELRKQLGSGG